MKSMLLALVSLGFVCTSLGVRAEIEATADPSEAGVRGISIASQPLADALQELARKTNIQFVYLGDIPEGHVTQPLGDMADAPSVLRALLAETSMDYEFVDENTVLIKSTENQGKDGTLLAALGGNVDGSSAGTFDLRSAQSAANDEASSQGRRAVDAERKARTLEEVVVTARKREESLFDVPLSISAFSQTAIDSLGINTIGDLSRYTPGFEFQDVGQGGVGGRGNPNIRFRGVAVQNESPSSRAGAVFWDGAYMSSGSGILPLYDLQRVEVIKGPQNAFYGRNTFAGAVNFIPNTDAEELNGKLSARFSPSQESSYDINGSIGIPLGERSGIRLGAFIEKVGADYEFDNGDPLGEEKTYALNFAFTSDITDKLRVKATGFRVESEDTRLLQSQDFTNAPGECNRTYTGRLRSVATGELSEPFTTDISNSELGTFCGKVPDWDKSSVNISPTGDLTSDPSLDLFSGSLDFAQTLPPELEGLDFPDAPDGFGTNYELWRINLAAEYELPADHTIEAIYSMGESSDWSISDQFYGQSSLNQARLTGFMNYSKDESFEVRLASSGDKRLRYQLGISYYENEFAGSTIPAFAGAAALGPAFGAFDDNSITATDSENLGVFGSIDFDLRENLTLSLEGRWNEDTQTIVYSGPTSRDGDVPFASGEEQSYSKFMPRIMIAYQPSDSVNLYGSWSQSYLQGNQTQALTYSLAVPDAGINPDTVGFFTPIQKLDAFELGIKAQLSDSVNTAFSVYRMQWDNQVQFELAPLPARSALYTPGDSEYYGAEWEFAASLSEWLTVSGNVTYVDVEFTDFAGAGSVAEVVLAPGYPAGQQISAIGNRPRYISEWTGAIAATVQLDRLLDFPVPVYIRGDANYQGQFYIDNFEYNSVDGYWKLNARVGVDLSDRLSIELYGTNLTDDQSWITAGGTIGGDTASFGFANRKTFSLLPARREFGVLARMNF